MGAGLGALGMVNLSAADPQSVAKALEGCRRILLCGPAGSGKSVLARRLAPRLAPDGPVFCLGADPGSPPFGIPGAVSLGRWEQDGWRLLRFEALCSLDAARFRLPLVEAAGRLLEAVPRESVLIVDPAGVVRGVAGSELLPALAGAAAVDCAVALIGAERTVPLEAEFVARGVPLLVVRRHPAARRPGPRVRERVRTSLWAAYLEGAREYAFELSSLAVTGTPPPLAVPEAWTGRQAALLARGLTLAMGEVIALEGDRLRLRVSELARRPTALMVRDAARLERGRLGTVEPFAGPARETGMTMVARAPAQGATGPPLALRVGPLEAVLVNGVFGDPLVHLRMVHRPRRLLFDLGEGRRLPARVAHQVTDVFVSHAHFDHIAAFLWLLRARIGLAAPCRLYGPPGLSMHLDGFLRGILWDRIGDRGPRFHVSEWDGIRLRRFELQAGRPGPVPRSARPAPHGVLLDEPGFRVRAALLDHHTPVLAFAFEPAREIHVRKDRLAARGLAPGPWLGTLKRHIQAGRVEEILDLPGGRRSRVRELAADLMLVRPGRRLVYATDLADTPENRARLMRLAGGAHTLFCEAAFAEADREQARRTGHLTARACGRIAKAAAVARLVPFYFSRRYERDPWRVYREVAEVFPRTIPAPEVLSSGGGILSEGGEPEDPHGRGS